MSDVIAQLRDYYDNEVQERAARPLGQGRDEYLSAFVRECAARGVSSVVEVGSGAGRDGTSLVDAGLSYAGIDLSPKAVEYCRSLGLDVREALATELPFADGSFDAAWTMSTLMHLEGESMEQAISELRRVARPGGLVEIGVWGNNEGPDEVRRDGRYFRLRTDDEFRSALAPLGSLDAFDTWSWADDGWHYQWARITVRG